MLNDPPILNLPSNKEEIAISDFPNIIFSWTPRQLNATNVSYSFELKEILDPTMDPSFAFEVSRSLYKQEDLCSTTLVYDINKPNLLPGKRYVWRVRAISTSGLGENSVFKNNGYSQVYSFTYTSSCSAPRFLLSEQQSNNRVKILWQGENSQQRYHVQYRKAGVNNAEWFDQHTVNTQTILSNLEPGFTYEFRVGASCSTTSYGVEPSYTYSSIQTFSIDAQNNATAYNCGIVPDLKVSNMQPLGGLVINETFMAGDFPVKVMDVSGSNGVFSGKGYIKVPYLFDTKIAVEFLNVEINTDYQLVRGMVETTYDPDWSSVDFIDDLVDTNQKEEKVPFEIAQPDGITIDPNTGEIVVKAEDGSTETFPGGKDTVITDSENNVYYVDKDGKVSGPTKQAEGGKPSPANTDGVDKNGEVKEFTAKGISITFESETLFDKVVYEKALMKDYKKVGGNFLPFKGVINGKEGSVIAKVNLTDSSIVLDSLVFKTSAGAKIDATRIANTNNFELTVKGMQSNAVEEVQASIKQGAKYKVAGAFKLVHMNTHTVELRLVPTRDEIDLNKVSTSIQEIYAQVGVRVNIDIKPVFDISAYLENNQLPTVKDDKLSTYSGAQQRLFTDYQSKNALDKAYYLFVTDKASSIGVEGYMRLNGQYGFVFNALKDKESTGRTAAHEFGHGAFRLEHPFVEYKKDLKEGNTNSLMDYQTTSTSFIYTNWRQINDPKLKFYTFQGQSEGEHVDGNFELTEDNYFITPSNKIFQLPKGSIVNFYKVNSPQKVVNGAIYGFTLPNGNSYQVKFDQFNYIIQFGNTKFSGYYQEMGGKFGQQFLDQKNYQVGKYPVYLILLIHEETVNGAIHYKYNIVKADIDITNVNLKSNNNLANDPLLSKLSPYKNPVVIKEITQVLNFQESREEVFKIHKEKSLELLVFFNEGTGKYEVNINLLGQPKDKKSEGEKDKLEAELKAIAEEKLNDLGGLDSAKSKKTFLNVFDIEGADAGEFYVAEMNGREWLYTIGDLGVSVWEKANLPDEYWNKDKGYQDSKIHVPPLFAGVSNGVTEEVLGLQQLAKLGYDVATKEELRDEIWESVSNITFSSVIDAGDEAIKNKINQYANHVEKPYIAQHALGKDAIQAVTTVTGIGVITKGGKLAEGVKSVGKQVGKIGKYDWNLVRKYFKFVEKVTNRKVHPKQIEKLKEALRNKNYDKLSKSDLDSHRRDFNKKKNDLIKEWELETGQEWPKYTESVYSKNGTEIRKPGDLYDAHHIIENKFGGDNEWWNMHPAKFPDEHQGGIHGAGSPSRELFK